MKKTMRERQTDSVALTWSQQDFGHEWQEESWPLETDGVIACLNPHCSSEGFERVRLVEIVSAALDSGGVVAGAIRCSGIDRANVTPCTNALVYMMETD